MAAGGGHRSEFSFSSDQPPREFDPTDLVINQVRETAGTWFQPLLGSLAAPTPEQLVATSQSLFHMRPLEKMMDEMCSICLDNFQDPSQGCVKLFKCSAEHFFHPACITAALKIKMRCPNCTISYSTARGLQPEGRMIIMLSDFKLPGEEDSQGTYVVLYQFPHGIQGPLHPNPGVPYLGTSRRGYIPATPHGRQVLRKFLRAWDARLLFTVGTSVTTGRPNCVIWNGIHHKTNVTGGPCQFGYPDPDYLTRVEAELAAVGIE